MPFVGPVTRDHRWERTGRRTRQTGLARTAGTADDYEPHRRGSVWLVLWGASLLGGADGARPASPGHALGALAGYLLLCFNVALGVLALRPLVLAQYWRGLRDYQS